MVVRFSASRAVALFVVCSGALGCGEDKAPSSATATESCVLLINGTELCGERARAYCREFTTQAPADDRSIQACRSVGLDIPPTRSERAADEAADEAVAEEVNERRAKERDRAARPFRLAVRRAMGRQGAQLDYVEFSGLNQDAIAIDTTFGQRPGRPVRPKGGVLTKMCAAVQSSRPALEVIIRDAQGEELKRCPGE